MTPKIHTFENDVALVEALAVRIAAILSRAVEARGQASLAVSGGRTPVNLYRRLSAMKLPWHDVIVSLVDERWVDEDHPDSNAALVKRTLLQGPAAGATFVGMKNADSDPANAQLEVSERLKEQILPLDVVILGMGDDGHTASLFPGAQGTTEAMSVSEPLLCRGIHIPGADYARMTLTVPALIEAGHRFLYITGQTKRAVLENALQPGSPAQLPVRAVLQAPVDTEIYYAAG